MTYPDLLLTLAGTGTVTTLAAAIAGHLTGRARTRADLRRLEAERQHLASQAAQAVADAAAALS